MKKKIIVVVKEPHKQAEQRTIDNDVDGLQKQVGGFFEAFYGHPMRAIKPKLHWYLNENGKNDGLEPNVGIAGDVLVGPIVVSACNNDGEEIGLTEAEATETILAFKKMEAQGKVFP